jgi:hypothetical protein
MVHGAATMKMVRGTLPISVWELMAPGTEGGWTRHVPWASR